MNCRAHRALRCEFKIIPIGREPMKLLRFFGSFFTFVMDLKDEFYEHRGLVLWTEVLTFRWTIHVTCMTARLGPFSFSFQWRQLCNRELSQRSVVLWRGDRAQKVLIHLYQRSGAWSIVINGHRCWGHRIINIPCEWHTIFKLSSLWICRIKSKVLIHLIL